jgi:hypothetical protein
MRFSRSALFYALVALQDVDALRLGLRGWIPSPSTSLRRRASISGLNDKNNVRYYTNLTLNGQAISASKSPLQWLSQVADLLISGDCSNRYRKVRRKRLINSLSALKPFL